jgi:chemotaxis protein methyltransferase WspC
VAAGDALRRALYLEPEHYASLVQLALHADARGDRAAAERARAKAERVRARQDAAAQDASEGGGR